MKTFVFGSEPKFSELWDVCLHELLYNKDFYVSEILGLFKKLKIDRSSKILDSCAGTGFISLYLRGEGFDVDCMDLMKDEIDLFKKKANSIQVNSTISQLSWNEIPKKYNSSSYDFLFCRGNSFIYAAGGWNESCEIDLAQSLSSYEKTLKVFYDVLKERGYLYLDKFPDDEVSHKDLVAKIKVGDKEKDLLFCTNRLLSKNYREAALITRDHDGAETGIPNVSYDLSEKELDSLLMKVGFRKIERLKLKSEKNFVVWLAQK